MDEADQSVLAIDVGGTKIAAALVGSDGSVLASRIVPTRQVRDPEAIFAPAAEAITALLSTARTTRPELARRPLRVGIGSAGPIDGPRGTVSPVNILGWREYPIVERVTEVVLATLGTAPRVRLAGDGHCFALGEHWLGAGKDVHSMIGMVVSTGVGGGAVIRDELLTGTSGNAVHLGHITVNAWGPRCVCGCPGCTESYARGPALVAAARARGWEGGDDMPALAAAARAGDAIALDVIDYGMRALAAGIATTATELDVSVVVLGGGVSKAGEVIFAPLRRHLREFAVLPYVRGLELRPAELENAGLLGAAALARTLPAGPVD